MILQTKTINQILEVLQKCSKICLEYYNSQNNFTKTEVTIKSDQSPVTSIDKKINDILINTIVNKIAKDEPFINSPDIKFSKIVIISEECKTCKIDIDSGNNLRKESGQELSFFIDPIDGTGDFIKKTTNFTINIGICLNNSPIAGFIVAPAIDRCIFGMLGLGGFVCNDFTFKKDINLEQFSKITQNNSQKINDLTLTISKSKKENIVSNILSSNGLSILNILKVSSSLKGAMVCLGEADIYYRLGETYEWDIAAMHAIALSCGLIVKNIDGTDIVYQKYNQRYKNTIGFCIINNEKNFVKIK